MTVRLDLAIRRGETFQRSIRWEAAPVQFRAISHITQAAPAVLTVPAHGIPDGWRCAVVSARGMTQLNAADDPPRDADHHRVRVVDANTIRLDGVNASGSRPYTGGGYLRFNTPVDLAGFTARMAIRDRVGGTLLHSLTTANGALVIDASASSVAIELPATVTAAWTWKRGVYDLEMVSADGRVTALLSGAVTVTPEVTT